LLPPRDLFYDVLADGGLPGTLNNPPNKGKRGTGPSQVKKGVHPLPEDTDPHLVKGEVRLKRQVGVVVGKQSVPDILLNGKRSKRKAVTCLEELPALGARVTRQAHSSMRKSGQRGSDVAHDVDNVSRVVMKTAAKKTAAKVTWRDTEIGAEAGGGEPGVRRVHVAKRKAEQRNDVDGFHISVRDGASNKQPRIEECVNRGNENVSTMLNHLELIKERAISTLRERFYVTRTCIRRKASIQSRLPLFLLSTEKGPHMRVKQVVCDRVCPSPMDDALRVDVNRGGTTSEIQCHETDGNFSDCDMPTCELNQYPRPSPTLTEGAVASMYVWTDASVFIAELREYWAEGKGAIRPFCFGSAVEGRLRARAEALQMLEDAYVEKHCKAQEDLRTDSIEPTCPSKPPMPALYHLKEYENSVSLPWTWDCESGNDFLRNWENTVQTDEFKDKLMRCAYWWIRRKVSVIIPETFYRLLSFNCGDMS
jgi:hypothetical protein